MHFSNLSKYSENISHDAQKILSYQNGLPFVTPVIIKILQHTTHCDYSWVMGIITNWDKSRPLAMHGKTSSIVTFQTKTF